MKVFKTAMTYFRRHEMFNGAIHALAGVGIGILITYPLAGVHPVRWGLFFLALGVAGHVWAATHKP